VQTIEPTPQSESFSPVRGSAPTPTEITVCWDPSLVITAPMKPEAVAEHDENQLPVALDEIEGKRLALEALQDDDLFKLCL